MPLAQVTKSCIVGDTTPIVRFGRHRVASRRLAILPLTVKSNGKTSVGLLRDIGSAGPFLFAKLTPALGAELLVFTSAGDQSLRMCCKCRVVRVEPSVEGATTGIGVTIEGYGE